VIARPVVGKHGVPADEAERQETTNSELSDNVGD